MSNIQFLDSDTIDDRIINIDFYTSDSESTAVSTLGTLASAAGIKSSDFLSKLVKTGRTKKVSYKYKRAMSLQCQTGGIKPKIDLAFTLIPQQNVVNITVSITNFHVDIDIRSYQKLVIEAGYRDSNKVLKMEVSVFRSWNETVGPDMKTVFQGIITTSGEDFLINRYIHLDIWEDTTIENYIKTVCELVGNSEAIVQNKLLSKTNPSVLTADLSGMSKQYLQKKIKVPGDGTGIHQSASNGYAMLNIMMKTLRATYPSSAIVIMSIFQNTLIISDNISGQKTSASLVTLPSIDKIYSASFMGSALTLTAPWRPDLRPGTIFRMNPKYYNGSGIVTNMDDKIFVQKDKLYTVITMEVHFSTTGNTNEMSIKALPMNTEDGSEASRSFVSEDQIMKTASEVANDYSTRWVEGKIGNDGSVTKEVGSMPENRRPVKHYKAQWIKSVNVAAAQALVSGYAPTYPKVPGPRISTISAICQQVWQSKGYYVKTWAELQGRELVSGSSLSPSGGPPGIPSQYWWPIVAACTYAYSQLPNTSDSVYVQLLHPNAIEEGQLVVVPDISNPDSALMLKDVFKALAQDAFKEGDIITGRMLGNIYVYMGGTWSD